MLTELQKQTVENYRPIALKSASTFNCVIAQQKFCGSSTIDYDDCRSIGHLALIEAVQKYDKNRGVSLGTFVYRRVQQRIIDELRNQGSFRRLGGSRGSQWMDPDYNDDEIVASDYTNYIARDDLREAMWKELKLILNDRDYYIVYEYYVNKRTMAEIAVDLDLTESRISQKLKKIQRKLKKNKRIRKMAA